MRLGISILAGAALATLFAGTAMAQSARPLFATTAEKCLDPEPAVDGLAVFQDRVVGLEWSCRAGRGRLALGGAAVSWACSMEGETEMRSFQLVGDETNAALIQNGNIADADRLISCASVTSRPAPARRREPVVDVGHGVLGLPGDAVTADGRFVKVHEVEFRRGESAVIRVTSMNFDTIAIIEGHGYRDENDDGPTYLGTGSWLDFTAPASGVYRIYVTSYSPSERGAYEIEVERN